jgi:hypothetical protein
MLWKELSNEAKQIIEWVESPLTNKRMVLTVEKNTNWFMRCPAWDGDVNVFITEKLFNEIRNYINSDRNIEVIEDGEQKLVFTLVKTVKVH